MFSLAALCLDVNLSFSFINQNVHLFHDFILCQPIFCLWGLRIYKWKIIFTYICNHILLWILCHVSNIIFLLLILLFHLMSKLNIFAHMICYTCSLSKHTPPCPPKSVYDLLLCFVKLIFRSSLGFLFCKSAKLICWTYIFHVQFPLFQILVNL